MEDMGKRIEALRLARRWSQTKAARELGISQPSLSDIESGVTKSLNGKTVAMLCRVFQTTAEYICFGADADGDPEMPLIEAELVYMNRALGPERRRAVLDAARGIFRGGQEADKNNPFPAREPGDSQPAGLDAGSRLHKQRRLQNPLAPATTGKKGAK